MKNYRVSIAFAMFSDGALDELTSYIMTSMSTNPAFPAPPVTMEELAGLQTTFRDAITAAAEGGKQATAVKNAAREALLNALRRNATYVQTVASHDLAMLLSSGFDAASTNRTQAPLVKPVILRIENEASTTLTVRLSTVSNARAYEGRLSTSTGTWQPAGTFIQARRVILANLTPGSTYTLQFRAVGGSMGYSDWSDPVSHMAT
jgi:hypothetical protein